MFLGWLGAAWWWGPPSSTLFNSVFGDVMQNLEWSTMWVITPVLLANITSTYGNTLQFPWRAGHWPFIPHCWRLRSTSLEAFWASPWMQSSSVMLGVVLLLLGECGRDRTQPSTRTFPTGQCYTLYSWENFKVRTFHHPPTNLGFVPGVSSCLSHTPVGTSRSVNFQPQWTPQQDWADAPSWL
jgi:hypothetical protein